MQLTHGSLFSGIGAPDLAAEWMGWTNLFHCEINPFPRHILNFYWPNAASFKDVKKIDYAHIKSALRNRGIRNRSIDVLTGGFPCQPYSTAGLRKGKEDERHLWPYMLNTIRTVRPRWVVGENVRGLLNWNGGLVFHEVQSDLEALGYEVLPFLLPACGVNAPHLRYRIWFIAFDGRKTLSNSRFDRNADHNEFDSERRIPKGSNAECGGTGGGHGERPSSNAECMSSIERHQSDLQRGRKVEAEQTWLGGSDLASNAASGLQQGDEPGKCGSERRETFQQEHGQADTKQPGTMGENGNASNTDSNERSEGRMHAPGSETAEFNFSPRNAFGNGPTGWDFFPTQSPVCRRNDGVSAGLDKDSLYDLGGPKRKRLTFIKWRQESIKAYGNAIVPKVMFEIFKAIKSFEIHIAATGYAGGLKAHMEQNLFE